MFGVLYHNTVLWHKNIHVKYVIVEATSVCIKIIFSADILVTTQLI